MVTDDETPQRADQLADEHDTPQPVPHTLSSEAPRHASPGNEIDLAGIEADLDGVQAALARLADGSYWTDEVTGEAIPTATLAADPLSRRA